MINKDLFVKLSAENIRWMKSELKKRGYLDRNGNLNYEGFKFVFEIAKWYDFEHQSLHIQNEFLTLLKTNIHGQYLAKKLDLRLPSEIVQQPLIIKSV